MNHTFDFTALYSSLPDNPSLEDLQKAELVAKIAKLEEERRGYELINEAKSIDIEAHRTKASQNYVFTFYGDIMPETVYECMGHLDVWRRKAPEQTQFTIMLNSPGGSVKDGFGLFDFIQGVNNTHPVKIKVFGAAESMGAVILQAGAIRAMQPNAHLLLHETSVGSDEGYRFSASQVGDTAKRMDEVNDRIYSILAARSNTPKSTIKRRCNRKDAYIQAEEALKLGLVDVIEV